MRPISEIIDARIRKAISAAAGVEDAPAAVRASQDERFGDFQANGVMSLAKRLRRPGPELAAEVIEAADLSEMADEVTAAGPGFINIRLRGDFLERVLETMAADERLGVDCATPPETVVVDFSSPNVAKEMHIGHIRSTIIGDSISRVLEFLGHRVRRVNHVGDWGTQFGMLIQYLKENDPDAVSGKRELNINDLEEFYRAAKERFDADPEFREAARREVVKLQKGDPESLAAWRAICEESRRKFKENYEALDVKLEEMGESFYNDMLPEVVEDLVKRGIARESEGALCVFLEGFSSPFIVRKKDGGYLYATTDLAALKYRVERLGARRVIYVTDSRQKNHFRQLFATARLAGWAGPEVRLEHAAFGSVLGKDGKPLKTREGRNIRLKEVIEEAVERAVRVVRAKNPDLPSQEQEKIARIVGIGALKYADLRQNPASDYIFDWDRMLSLDGDTAPYLQYAYARIRSIFRKGGVDPSSLKGERPAVTAPAERRLALWLSRYNEIVETAARELRPNVIANFLYELAVRLTAFYGECPVLKAPPELRTGRLVLCDLTARVLRQGLSLLGIAVSERM